MIGGSKSSKFSGQGGFTLSPIYIIYAAVALLALFWTWKVLIAFAILWVAAILFAYFDDRRHSILTPNLPAEPTPEFPSLPPHANRTTSCAQCGGKLFIVEPGVTTAEEIASFAQKANSWKENTEAIAGWMPPGVYCTKGCSAIHITPPGPATDDSKPLDEEDGIPSPFSIRWADVMRDGGSYVLVYDTKRQESVKVLLKVITTGKIGRTGYRKPLLITVDPATYQEKARREINWEEAASLGESLMTVLMSSKTAPGMGGALRASEMIRFLSLQGGL